MLRYVPWSFLQDPPPVGTRNSTMLSGSLRVYLLQCLTFSPNRCARFRVWFCWTSRDPSTGLLFQPFWLLCAPNLHMFSFFSLLGPT